MTGQRVDFDALLDYVDHFQHRVLQDALAQATRSYWLRRAAVWEAARPRRGDFTGQASIAELVEADQRCAETALACRRRAEVSLLWDDPADEELVECVLAELAEAEGVA